MQTLQILRQTYQPKIPKVLKDLTQLIAVEINTAKPETSLSEIFPHLFNQKKVGFKVKEGDSHEPLKVGLVFSGGQAPGGHNVVSGIFDALKSLNAKSQIFGFLDGPSGIIENSYIELTDSLIQEYRNQGGFDLLGSGRTKIETFEQFAAAGRTAKQLKLDGLVIIGGDDSNTNAALLAEYYLKENIPTRVIGVPKTIDGDLKNEDIEISFGFDTATKTYSNTIGNILRDCLSAKKYYYFIKLMGRSASHITLECALQTHPNLTLIGEEVAEKKMTLEAVTNQICDMICQRADQHKDFGVILIPEGLIEFIPEMKSLIAELNRLKLNAEMSGDERIELARTKLTSEVLTSFKSLPSQIQSQLLLDRDPHGNVQVSKIETERLLIQTVKSELKKRKEKGKYSGKFSAQPIFCGYEGRSCLPTNFDCNYCYTLGQVAALLIDQQLTGYICSVKNLSKPVEEWEIAGAPLIGMIHLEERKGKQKPVIEKALVDVNGGPFDFLQKNRKSWEIDDDYNYPGPVQFYGPEELTDATTLTLELEHKPKIQVR